MSSSSEFSGQKPARSPERPNFNRTCSLLSQYLKEKGSFGDLSLGMTCDVEAKGVPETSTMDLFPVSAKSTAAPGNLKAMELFPQQAGLSPSALNQDNVRVRDSRANKPPVKQQPQAAQQMTIFYNGQVIVFNGIMTEQAKEIMEFAKGCSPANSSSPSCPFKTSNVNFPSSVATGSAAASSGVAPKLENLMTREPMQTVPPSIACDLPIARRASVQRFLEKRKDRISAKAPYQTGSPAEFPSKPVENKSWLALAAQPKH